MKPNRVLAGRPCRGRGRGARAPLAVVAAVAVLLELKTCHALSPLPSAHPSLSRHGGGDGYHRPFSRRVGALAPQRLGPLAAKKKGKKGGKGKQPKTR